MIILSKDTRKDHCRQISHLNDGSNNLRYDRLRYCPNFVDVTYWFYESRCIFFLINASKEAFPGP
jgi:hypothetical protein